MTSRTLAPPDESTRSILAAEEGGFASTRDDLCLLVSTTTSVRVERLANATSILGRAADANVVVDDTSVSRHHAKIVVGDGGISLVDLESRNGSKVDGLRVPPGGEVPLRLGAVVELGSTTLILQRASGFENAPQVTRAPARREVAGGPIVRDPAIARLYGLLDVIGPSRLAVLILGETGTGKEVFAAQVHARSNRHEGPFVKLNCAAIPETLLEGELFGYERGAFTGAVQAKAGLFESADKGTCFLDEIGEVPLGIQAKLLRVLESGEVQRLGSLKPRVVDVRIVSATNRNLRTAIGDGRFRADLFFRLNGVSLTIPPLRSRVLEVEPLAQFFIASASEHSKRRPPRISADARAALEAYPWPGNVRELKSAVERAVVMCQGDELRTEHLMLGDGAEAPGGQPTAPPTAATLAALSSSVHVGSSLANAPVPNVAAAPPSPNEPGETSPLEGGHSRAILRAKIEEMDKKAILDALEKCMGNQTRAAKMLGMTRRALVYRIEQYGIARPRPRNKDNE